MLNKYHIVICGMMWLLLFDELIEFKVQQPVGEWCVPPCSLLMHAQLCSAGYEWVVKLLIMMWFVIHDKDTAQCQIQFEFSLTHFVKFLYASCCHDSHMTSTMVFEYEHCGFNGTLLSTDM